MSGYRLGNTEQEIFTYEDFLALSDEEKQRIDAEVDAMPVEELRALGEKLANFIHKVDILDLELAGFEGD